jgi:hypothetical protein
MQEFKMKGYIKTFVWGMATGMVVLLIVVFSAGWVVTSSTAKATAHEISTNAMVERLGPISVLCRTQTGKSASRR